MRQLQTWGWYMSISISCIGPWNQPITGTRSVILTCAFPTRVLRLHPSLLITLSSFPADLARNGTTVPAQGPQHWHLQFLPCSTPSFTRLLIDQAGGAPIRAPPIPPTNLLGQISSRTGHRRNSLLPPRRNKSHLRQTQPEQRGPRKSPFQPNSRRNCFKEGLHTGPGSAEMGHS